MHTFCFSTFGAVKILEIDQIHRLWLLLCRSLYSSLASFELVEWQAKQPTTTTDLIKIQVPLPGQSLLQCLHFDSRFHGKSIQSVKSIFFRSNQTIWCPYSGFTFHRTFQTLLLSSPFHPWIIRPLPSLSLIHVWGQVNRPLHSLPNLTVHDLLYVHMNLFYIFGVVTFAHRYIFVHSLSCNIFKWQWFPGTRSTTIWIYGYGDDDMGSEG